MESLHRNWNPKMEIVTRDMGMTVIDLTMLSFGEIWTLGLCVKKAVEGSKSYVIVHTSEIMEDSVAGGNLIFES